MSNLFDYTEALAYSFYALDEATQLTMCDWIKSNLVPCKEPNLEYSSYSLKHLFEDATSIYVDNNAFRYGMLKSGFVPIDIEEMNHHYCINPKSSGFKFKCI